MNVHYRTWKQVKHLWFAKLRIFCEFFFSTEKKFVKFVKFQEWKKFVKFEFSIYASNLTQRGCGFLIWIIVFSHYPVLLSHPLTYERRNFSVVCEVDAPLQPLKICCVLCVNAWLTVLTEFRLLRPSHKVSKWNLGARKQRQFNFVTGDHKTCEFRQDQLSKSRVKFVMCSFSFDLQNLQVMDNFLRLIEKNTKIRLVQGEDQTSPKFNHFQH